MFPIPDYYWHCPKCKYELGGYKDQAGLVSQQCPKCGEVMIGEEMVKRGPGEELSKDH